MNIPVIDLYAILPVVVLSIFGIAIIIAAAIVS